MILGEVCYYEYLRGRYSRVRTYARLITGLQVIYRVYYECRPATGRRRTQEQANNSDVVLGMTDLP